MKTKKKKVTFITSKFKNRKRSINFFNENGDRIPNEKVTGVVKENKVEFYMI